jgi:hypothetical protein
MPLTLSGVESLLGKKIKKARQSLAKYFFTIHYYLLLPPKSTSQRIVKSEELIVKK